MIKGKVVVSERKSKIETSFCRKLEQYVLSMSSPKKDPDHQQGTGVVRGRPPMAVGAAVPVNHEGKTPKPPQKVEKSSRKGSGDGGGRGPGRGGGAEGGQLGKKKQTTKEERRALQVSGLLTFLVGSL